MSEETKAKQLKKALGYEPKLVTKTMPEEEIRRPTRTARGTKPLWTRPRPSGKR